MLTVNHTDPDENEHLFEAVTVKRIVKSTPGCDMGPGIYVETPEGNTIILTPAPNTSYNGGTVFVMNHHGQTVAKYNL